MSKLPICNMQGERLGEHTVADELLELKKGSQAVHDAVKAHRAKLRSGTASTLRKGEVAGGGAKPYKQKGTGRARAGSIRSPIWRGGGSVFGPKPRSFEQKVNRKSMQLAFCRAFSEKVAAGEVMVVDQLSVPDAKTRNVAEILKKLKVEQNALFVVDALDRNLSLAVRNMPKVEVAAASNVHTYQMLRSRMMVVSKSAMAKLEERLKVRAGRNS